MTINPGRDYVEGSINYESIEAYTKRSDVQERCISLPPVTYLSRIFADLEDEKIWTRRWVAIGPAEQIPAAGDLLPFTVGNHALHVQRQQDGRLVARFNKAQHGGCRFVPSQCQMGKKTNCSYTSCGYSLDEGAIRYAELDDPNRRLGQYLGHNPGKLWSAKVREIGGQLFVHADPYNATDATLPSAAVHNVLGRYAEAGLRMERDIHWKANWKLLLSACVQAGASFCPPESQGPYSSNFIFLYPNLCIESDTSGTLLHLLQPVATNVTRVITFSVGTVAKPKFEALRSGCEEEQSTLESYYASAWCNEKKSALIYEHSPINDQPEMRRYLRYLVNDLVRKYPYESTAVVYLDPSFSARRN